MTTDKKEKWQPHKRKKNISPRRIGDFFFFCCYFPIQLGNKLYFFSFLGFSFFPFCHQLHTGCSHCICGYLKTHIAKKNKDEKITIVLVINEFSYLYIFEKWYNLILCNVILECIRIFYVLSSYEITLIA